MSRLTWRIVVVLGLLAAVQAGCGGGGGSDLGAPDVVPDTAEADDTALPGDVAAVDEGRTDAMPADPGADTPVEPDPGTWTDTQSPPDVGPTQDFGNPPDLPGLPDLPGPPPLTPYPVQGWPRYGAPSWEAVDLQVFRTVCGAAPGTPEAWNSALQVATLHKLYPDQQVLGPAEPHAGPYETELARSLEGQGKHWAVQFTDDAFLSPACVMLMFTLVPKDSTAEGGKAPPTGATSDFASGPMIDPAVTPFSVLLQDFLERPLDDDPFLQQEIAVPSLATLTPLPAGEGYSHVIVAIPMNGASSWGIGAGYHRFALTVTDAAGGLMGAVFEINITTSVTPETCDTVGDLLSDRGCREGRTCTLVQGSQWGLPTIETGCRPIGTKAPWETCAGSDECPAGTFCETENGWRGCYPFCGLGKPCPEGTTCAYQTDKDGVKLCSKP